MLKVADAREGLTPSRADGDAAAVQIRPCVPGDIPAVARLFRETFRKSVRAGSASLEDYLRQVFLDHPWHDPDLKSLGFVNPDGTVGGFIGILPVPMLFNGVRIRAAIAGTLMVDRPGDNPLAGARLLRSFFNGPQDLSISDSANELAQRMWSKLGGVTAGAYSMEWLRVFKPASFAIAVGCERNRAIGLLRPFAFLADALVGLFRGNPFRLDATDGTGVDVGDDEMIAILPRLAEPYVLRPEWDPATLRWLLANAARKERFGDLVRRVVNDRNGNPIGAYLYCIRPRGIAFVLQILAAKGREETVVDDLIADAARRGAVGMRGRTQPEFADVLLRRRAIFVHAASTVVHSKRSDLLAVITRGDALITGFAGESWSRLIGGTFY